MCDKKLTLFVDDMLYFLNTFSQVESTIYSEKMTFSNTQVLGNIFEDIYNQDSIFIKYLFDNAPTYTFPNPNSKEGKKEIKDLFLTTRKRSQEMQENIILELSMDGIYQQFNMTNKQTIYGISYWLDYINPVIVKLKVKNDRIRPSLLDKNLSTSIPVPLHPSFPSGHSSQSFFIAYFLGHFYPKKKESFLKIAENIAKNREYAGVHYNSDTEYGNILGKYFADTIYDLYYKRSSNGIEIE